MEGSDTHPKWYAHVCYVVPATQLPATPEAGAIGMDRNMGLCIVSNGKVYEMPTPTDGGQAQAVPAQDGQAAEGQPP